MQTTPLNEAIFEVCAWVCLDKGDQLDYVTLPDLICNVIEYPEQDTADGIIKRNLS